MIRTCVVGLGYWGRNLARVAQESPRFGLRAMVDTGLCAPFERPFATLPGYRSMDAAEAEHGFDAVLVATPASTHAAVVLDALERGYHVLVEKPLATSSADGEKLCAAARANDRVLMVDHTYLYSPRFLALHLAATVLGPAVSVATRRLHSGGPRDVSSLWDLLPHDLSIVGALVPGWAPEAVTAYGSAEVGRVTIHGAPGVQVMYSRDHPFKSRYVAVETERGVLAWEDVAEAPLTLERAGRSTELEVLSTVEPLAAMLGDFADAIEDRPCRYPVRSTGTLAVRGLRVIEAAERSLESGATETI